MAGPPSVRQNYLCDTALLSMYSACYSGLQVNWQNRRIQLRPGLFVDLDDDAGRIFAAYTLDSFGVKHYTPTDATKTEWMYVIMTHCQHCSDCIILKSTRHSPILPI